MGKANVEIAIKQEKNQHNLRAWSKDEKGLKTLLKGYSLLRVTTKHPIAARQ